MWAVPTKGGPNSTESNVGGHWLEICKLILEFIFWRITDFILPDKTNKKFNYFCAKILMEIKDFCWETDSDATPQSHALLTEEKKGHFQAECRCRVPSRGGINIPQKCRFTKGEPR